MSQQEFREQLDIASSLVNSWPLWQQKILESYASPFVAVAREPVDNNAAMRASSAEKGREEVS